MPYGSIRSWAQLKEIFTENFKSTYKRPATLEELRACRQRPRERLREYIQRWTLLKNKAEEISDESAVDAFRHGLRRVTFMERLRELKVKTVSELLEHANNWADGEDCVCNERLRTL